MASSDNKEPFETVEFSKVDGLAERFEQAWSAQQDTSRGVDILPFLPEKNDPARLPALHELVKADLNQRWQRGLPTSLETYVEKFPELGPLDKVSPRLVFEEFRIRMRNGFPAPLAQYKTRFPAQFAELERLIQTEQSQADQMTAASHPDFALESGQNLTAALPNSPFAVLGAGTLVGGHYTLTKRIGTGGFGEVWLGNDVHGNIPKAIKIIFRSIESDEAKTELHALEIIKRLNHPYLLRTEGFFAEQDRLIVVMELASEGSLREMLKKSRKENDSGLPVEKLLTWMRHAGEALDYLAEEGIFHRDIKPENILLVGKVAKVADFGLAKLAANRQSTKTNFAGTSAYSSPETWKGRVTAKSDLYSLAVTYGELRLGRPVFKGSTIYEFMIEHLQSQPNLDPMPEAEKQVMLRALAKDPADRYPTCAEFVRELERAVTEPGSLPSIGPWSPGAPTPVGSFRTATDDSMATPHRSQANKPPSWKTPTQPDLDVEPTEPPPYRRRRRRGPNPVAVGGGLIALVAVILGVASMFARSGLESKSQELAAKRDFVGALKAIDDGGLLASPFKSGLRDAVLKTGLDMAEKERRGDQLDELVKTTVALTDAFPSDKSAPALLNDALRKNLPTLIERKKYADAYALLNSLPADSEFRQKELPVVADKWLDQAWEEVDVPNFAAAKKITGDMLRINPYQENAAALDNLIAAAENVRGLILKGKYREVMQKIPRHVPQRGKNLADQLRGEVKAAWLKSADELTKNGKFDAAQQSLSQFSEYFKNDPAGAKLYDRTLQQLFKEYFAQDKYEDALALLEKSKFDVADRQNEVKQAWHAAEMKRFVGGDDADKERALQGLARLANRFADFQIADDYRKSKTAFVDGMLPRIDAALKVRNYPQMLDLIAKTEPYVDPSQETKIRSLQLLALVDGDAGADRKNVEKLLRQVMKQPDKVQQPEQILKGVLKTGAGDTAFFTSLRPELLAFRDVIPEDKLPAEFWSLPGMNKSDPTVVGSGSRRIIGDATRLFDASDYEHALKTLKQLDVKKETDKGIRKQYYDLYAKLGERGALTRDQVLGLELVVNEYPEIKGSLAKAMTQAIARAWKIWPAGSDTWASRLKDVEYAEPDQPIVLAFKAEALLESGKPVDFKLQKADGEEKPYVDYVAARIAATKKDSKDLFRAARTMEKLSPKDAWLVPSRREKASEILQAAAVDLAKGRLFESAQEANQAYAWLDKSLLLSSKSLKDAAALPWEAELALALACACKTPPAFDRNKTLGDDLFANHRTKMTDADRVNLALSNPDAFADELKKLKADSFVGVNEVDALLAVGDSQLLAQPDDDALKQRQGQLYALKGWALEQAPSKNDEAIFKAYSKAASYDPTGPNLIGAALYGAKDAIARAAHESNAESKIRILEQGIETCKPALKKNLIADANWAELCLARSQLALEVGNEYFRVNRQAGLKDAFLDARNYAQKAFEGQVKVKAPADVWLALGNAYEDLAHFARVDIPKNYEEAAKAFDVAAKLKPDYAYNAGRCRYRWANDSAGGLSTEKKKEVVTTALANLALASLNKKSPSAPEANYWEGYALWYLATSGEPANYAKAFAAFERVIALAQKNDKATLWAKFAADAIAQLARGQLKSDPANALKWAETAETTVAPFRKSPSFAGTEHTLTDVAAEAAVELAHADVTAKDYVKYKSHMDKAYALKHSTKAHFFAAERAVTLKNNRAAAGLSPQAIAEVYEQALSAIDAMPTLSEAQKKKEKAEFEAGWKSLK